MIQAITFDCWDTVLKDDAVIEEKMRAYFQKMCEGEGLYLTEAEVFDLFQKEKELFMQQSRKSLTTADAQQRIEVLSGLVKLAFGKEEKKEAAAFFDAAALEIPPPAVPGIEAALESLSQEYALALICNTGWHSGAVVRKLLERRNLLKYFVQLSFSDEIGLAKPHRKIFENTLTRLQCPPQYGLHIGDTEETDILGAKAVGMRTILFAGLNSGNGIRSKADFRIDDFRKLEQLLGMM